MKNISIFLFSIFYINSSFANITISPVILEINAKNETRSTSILLENAEDGVSHIYEVTPYKWTQNQLGEDQLEPASDIVINPRTIQLNKGDQRSVRIGFRQKLSEMDLKQEQSWRLLFQEIESPLENTGIGINVNFSIPLFAAEKPNTTSPNLEAILDEKTATLKIRNLNAYHIKIMGIDLINKEGATSESFPQLKYILANQEMILNLRKSDADQNIKAQIKIDQIDKPLLLPIHK
ncbi:fimbrial biogenesis chaperone [Acinetobacter bouvetii]|nr:fimbria/pilus periplasmic chaperone [Acinetobacter bouvetii]